VRSSSASKINWDGPYTDLQKQSLDVRANLVQDAPSFLHPDLSFFNPPADSRPFIVTPNPFVAYPAPGAGEVVVISYTVPAGLLAVINKLAVVHVGGNPPDGTGNVVWRVKQNGAGVKGMNALTSQVGTYAQPNDFVITAVENDIVEVTVEVPLGQPIMPPGTRTAARFHGWTYPLMEATLKLSQQGASQ
jgi:hypothetical protein